ncbi:hypothetical protein D3P09_18465 [Paenibacillus pinisoli]|uniref:DUF4179 domain-containing protein n=1 Tax=Paenibacillus pinisoli TaxID=1276110 RepID=A0A3A6PDC2_9BACL|nr:hypothetical protein [Paenibacillus pinisoli]RJX38060.1 hypothetical protein D3P09_18465 [Paenibacillus pinisoli]
MKDADLERVLRQSLAADAEPDERLHLSLIHQLKERNTMNFKYRKSLSAGLLAAVLLLVLSVSAYAATQLFSAKQVTEIFGDQLLAEAFESADAIEINQSKEDGDYRFILHGLVSGAGLSQFKHSAEEIYPDRTYAVVSIARQDGQPMPATADDEYGKVPFFISPLIKGLKPWQFNIASMNGAYNETVINGIMYRLIECDQVEIFADRGVYLAISSGNTFFRNEAFSFDEATGEIEAKEDYKGAAVLFDLPLDIAKANHEEAEAYIEKLLQPSQLKAEAHPDQEWMEWINELRLKLRDGESIGLVIPESVKEVTYDSSGNFQYEYKDWSFTASPEEFFREGQVGDSDRFSVSGKDDLYWAKQFHRDENGIITGRIIKLDPQQ